MAFVQLQNFLPTGVDIYIYGVGWHHYSSPKSQLAKVDTKPSGSPHITDVSPPQRTLETRMSAQIPEKTPSTSFSLSVFVVSKFSNQESWRQCDKSTDMYEVRGWTFKISASLAPRVVPSLLHYTASVSPFPTSLQAFTHGSCCQVWSWLC